MSDQEGTMTDDEAVAVCKKWFAHLNRQQARSEEMVRLAALARTGPEGQRQAQKEVRRMDRAPVLFDGAYLRPAVEHLVEAIERTERDD